MAFAALSRARLESIRVIDQREGSHGLQHLRALCPCRCKTGIQLDRLVGVGQRPIEIFLILSASDEVLSLADRPGRLPDSVLGERAGIPDLAGLSSFTCRAEVTSRAMSSCASKMRLNLTVISL